MSDRALTTEELRDALRDLASRLTKEEITANIYVVGGAALALADGARDATRDVDALYSPQREVEAVAVEVARDRGLPESWLNNKSQGFVSLVKDDPAPRPILSDGSVCITAASHEVLLAMKIGASRGRLDREDIAFLLRATGITTKEEALALRDAYFPEDPLTKRAGPILDAALSQPDVPVAQTQPPISPPSVPRRRDWPVAMKSGEATDTDRAGTRLRELKEEVQ